MRDRIALVICSFVIRVLGADAYIIKPKIMGLADDFCDAPEQCVCSNHYRVGRGDE